MGIAAPVSHSIGTVYMYLCVCVCVFVCVCVCVCVFVYNMFGIQTWYDSK